MCWGVWSFVARPDRVLLQRRRQERREDRATFASFRRSVADVVVVVVVGGVRRSGGRRGEARVCLLVQLLPVRAGRGALRRGAERRGGGPRDVLVTRNANGWMVTRKAKSEKTTTLAVGW